MTIGITSGGANSWDASLARQLRGKFVIILPDDYKEGCSWLVAPKVVQVPVHASRIEAVASEQPEVAAAVDPTN